MPWKSGPKTRKQARSASNYQRAKGLLLARRSKLLGMGGADHVGRPQGGGRDTQTVRARLTQIATWTITTIGYQNWLRNPAASTEWSYYASIYDQFKVNGMRISMGFPKYELGATTYTAGTGVAQCPTSVIFSYDNDTIIAVPTAAANFGYSTAKQMHPDGIVVYDLPTLPKGAAYGASALGYINSSEWQDCATPAALAGTVTAWLDRILVTGGALPLPVYISWDVTFRGKRN